MTPPRPIGVLRLIEPLLGRARRRWRGGPLVPMIWRRRLRARAAPPQAGRPASSTLAHILNLNLIWPAGTPGRAEPMRRGQDRVTGTGETRRLVTLVERLWLRTREGRAPPSATNAPPAVSAPRANDWPNGPGASPWPAGRSAMPPAASPPLVWPRTRIAAGGGEAAARDGAIATGRADGRRADTGVPRFRDLRRARAAAIRQGNESLARPASGAGPELEGHAPFAMRAAAMTWRESAPRAATPAPGPSRPSRARTPLVWRRDEAGGEHEATGNRQARRSSGTELVWRRASPVAARQESAPARGAAASGFGGGDVYTAAPRPGVPAPAAAAPAAIQPADMGRLVDEVVRRLDRIGRDERMRRGI